MKKKAKVIGRRYVIHLGRIHLGGKYKVGAQVSAFSNFDNARKEAYKLFRDGKSVLIIDRKMGAIIGNLWMLTKEIVE